VIQTIALSLLPLVLLAALVWERREHARERQQADAAHRAQCDALVAANERERERWARERGDLLQRIQAPAQAVVDHSLAQPAPLTMPPVIGMDNDEGLAALSTEELADLAAQAELEMSA
jgi:hypothetical protein